MEVIEEESVKDNGDHIQINSDHKTNSLIILDEDAACSHKSSPDTLSVDNANTAEQLISFEETTFPASEYDTENVQQMKVNQDDSSSCNTICKAGVKSPSLFETDSLLNKETVFENVKIQPENFQEKSLSPQRNVIGENQTKVNKHDGSLYTLIKSVQTPGVKETENDISTLTLNTCIKEDKMNESEYIKANLMVEIEDLTLKKKSIEMQIQQFQKAFNREKGEKSAEINKLKNTVIILKQEKFRFASDIASYQRDMGCWLQTVRQDVQQSFLSLEGQLQRDSQEKRELLSEMTSMNEELNRRGETISSLKEVVSMYEKKVIELNNQQDCDLSTIKQLRDELTDRTQRLQELTLQQEANSNTMSQLREELSNASARLQDLDSQQNVSNNTIKQLRDQLAAAAGNARELEAEVARLRDSHGGGGETDHLSTSTVSRVEESARLRDVEDSFEDRYCKLKVVAAKLKKRATETQQTLDSERQKWTAERTELVNKLNQLNASARNNQTLQQELDRLGDELEAERKEVKMLRKAATDAKTSEVNLKVKLEEALTNIDILKTNLDVAIRERDSIAQNLTAKEKELETALKERIAEELIRKEKAKEVAGLKERLKEEQEKLVEMQKTVESAKLEARKKGVLTLEIQNYEKSLSDMEAQLGTEKNRVASLEAEVQTLQDIRDSLLEQIKLLEERVATEDARCQQAQDELSHTRATLHQCEESAVELERRVGQLSAQLESERASAEAATLELATLSSAVQTNTDIMLKEKQELSHQVANLSSQVVSLTDSLRTKEEELATVRADFEKYKVRAASVLRKHQSSAATQAETEARQQADELRQLCDTLRRKLDESAAQVEKLQGELSAATNEREAAEARCVNLNIALNDKTKLLEKAIAEHRTQKLSLETLVQCYKSQLEEKEKSLQEQVASLTKELESVRSQLREQSSAGAVGEAVTAEEAPAAVRQEPPLLEREDGEGSEYIPEYSPSNTPPSVSPKPMLPLDKLLETNDNLHGEREQLEAEVSRLRSELEHSHVRAQHQAALLADAEQDAARKDHLVAVLKQEIGRLERCIQRQPHAKNTEYLKNVVFKFVTLEVGEDRLRLVPVITTLLQLSPEETQKLTVIAKGQSPDAGGSWSSYLPVWR